MYVKVSGVGSVLLDTITSSAVSTSGTFFGVYSSLPITNITLNNVSWEIVDNIQFGGSELAVNFYSDQTTFENAHPGLSREDFEESPVNSGLSVAFPEPLDYATNAPGAFSPGDILNDVHVRTISTPSPLTALEVLGVGSTGNSSKLVCSHNTTADDLQVYLYDQTAGEYEVDTYAVGMDLMQLVPSGQPPQDAVLAVYGYSGRLLGTTRMSILAGQENFIGIDSKQPVYRITFQFVDAYHECIDNIQFGGSLAGMNFYTSEEDFRKTRSNLPREDFSESPVADNTTQICNEPINSATSQTGCFAPGDILPGISFQTENSHNGACPACMNLAGANIPLFNNATPMLTVFTPDQLEISFSKNQKVHFAGMNLFYSTVIISLYGLDDVLLGTAVNSRPSPALGFWGVKTDEPISRITFSGPQPYLDEIMFGGKFPWSMFLPAIK